MKKQLILGGFVALAFAGYSQSAWNSTTQELEVTTTLPERGVRVIQNGGGSGNGAACFHLKNNTSGGMLWTLFSLGSGNTTVGSGNFMLSNSSDNGSTYSHRLFIDKTTGNIGFGTTAPANRLHVEVTSPDDGITVKQAATSGSIGSAALYLNNNSGHNWAFLSTGPANNIGASHFALYDVTQNQARFFINGSSGNVGIGTTSPSQKLDVNGNINTNGSFSVGSSFSLTSAGVFQNSAWAGTGNRILLSDATGKVTALAQGASTQVLYGNGTWGTLPAGAFTNSGSDLNLPTGKLGIGTTPTSALDVNGDAKIRNGVNIASFAGTGDRIVYVDASGNLKTSAVSSSTVAPSPCLTGAMPWYEGGNYNPANNTIGTCQATDFILKAQNNAVWIKPSGNVGIGNSSPAAKLDVGGNIQISAPTAGNPAFEIIQATASRFRTYGNGSTYIGTFASPANDFGSAMLMVGGSGTTTTKIFSVANNGSSITNPSDLFTVYGDGRTRLLKQFEIGDPANYINDANNTALTISAGAGKGIHYNTYNNDMPLIDITSSNFTGSPFTMFGNGRLEMRSQVATTKMIRMMSDAGGAETFVVYGDGMTRTYKGVQIGDPANILNDANNTALTISSAAGKGIHFNTWNNSMPIIDISTTTVTGSPFTVYGDGRIETIAQVPGNKMFRVTENVSGNEKFVVYGDGHVQIGGPLPSNHAHYYNMLSVNGKLVAKEVVVTTVNWPDYVFGNTYKLNSLEYLENYIKENKHLPNVPSAKEIETDGNNLGEIAKIQMEKIEELTLYIIELKKDLDVLKAELKNK